CCQEKVEARTGIHGESLCARWCGCEVIVSSAVRESDREFDREFEWTPRFTLQKGTYMKAIAIQSAFGIENLQIIERPEAKPGPGQVLVRMKAWSLNYRDLLVVKGLYNPKLKLPFLPLSDGAGEVVAFGAGVTHVKVGDRVASCFLQQWVG